VILNAFLNYLSFVVKLLVGLAFGFQMLSVGARAPEFVLNFLDCNVSVIDPVTWTDKPIQTVKKPSHLWIDSKSQVAWVSMQDSDELVAIDLSSQTVKSRTPVGAVPADVFGTPDDKFLLVGLTGGDGVEVYDISGKQPQWVKKIGTGQGAHAFRAMGDQRHVMVSNRVSNTISQIDYQNMHVVAHFPAPSGPDCMDITADGKTILVASRWARKLTVIDIATRKVVRQVPVGKSPHGVWTLDHAPRF